MPVYKCLDLSYLSGTQCKSYFMAYNLLQALTHNFPLYTYKVVL